VIFEDSHPLENVARWIDELAALGGESLREDFEAHMKEEYSTLDWIMDGLLERAGFRIKDRSFKKGVLGTYVCIKEKDSTGDNET